MGIGEVVPNLVFRSEVENLPTVIGEFSEDLEPPMKPCSVCREEVVVHEKEFAERGSGRQPRTLDAILDGLHAIMQKKE